LEATSVSPHQLLSEFITYLTLGIDAIAGIVIGIAVVIAFISFLTNLRKAAGERVLGLEKVRHRLARALLLVLDLQVASDMLKTILVPSATELLILAVIVAVRIALSWSLSKEVEKHPEDWKAD
jgi:uncharacterized membrane protein